MLVSLNWLKEFVDLPDNLTPNEIGQALTMSTVEVEGIKSQAELFAQMVVGRIVELKNHPNADNLKIVLTDIGQGNIVQIICGGTNLFVGMLVAVALPGTKVRWHGQGDLVSLAEATIRGEKSFGMICASNEISLGDLFPAAEKEILNLSSTDAKPGTALKDIFDFDDVILDIDNKSLTNRPDLWGHMGIARELAAIYNRPYKELDLGKIEKKSEQKIKVKIKSPTDCRRYLGVVITGVEVGPSPIWLKKRLESVGQKSINNIVDLTNYVMFETGQPLHAFDLKKISGHQIIVRKAVIGEKIVTLDNSEIRLDENTLVIADNKKPIALAGVMGGQESGINQNTNEIVFESACFNPITIRQAARNYNLRTDSAVRFEKGIEPERAEIAMRRILFLLKKIQPNVRIGDINDVYKYKNKPVEIKTDLNFIQNRLGFNITPEDISNILKRLGFVVKIKSKKFTIIPPVYRSLADVTKPEDIIEEVARIYGYDKFKPDLPVVKLTSPQKSILKSNEYKIKKLLAYGLGLYEVINYSFTNEKYANLGYDFTTMVNIKNSISSEFTHLRKSLLPGLLANVAANEHKQKDFGLFELGRVFMADRLSEFRRSGNLTGELIWQPYYLAGVFTGKKEQVFFQARGAVEAICNHLKLSNWELVPGGDDVLANKNILTLQVNNNIVGKVFCVADDKLKFFDISQFVSAWEIDFEALVKFITTGYNYSPLPKYPAVIYDLAVVFPQDVKWKDIEKNIFTASDLVREVNLFDIYVGDKIGLDKKSIAFTLTFSDPNKTLQMKEVEKEVDKILKKLNQQLQGVLRN